MPACLGREVADSQGRVSPEALGHRVDPGRRRTRGLPARSRQEPLQRRPQSRFRNFRLAGASEIPRLSADAASDPKRDRQRRNQTASKPGRIEFDLDLLEPDRRGRIAMPCAGAVEDRGGAGDEALSYLGLVQIGADHEERKNGPVMGVLGHPGIARVDDPSEGGSAVASQQQITRPIRRRWLDTARSAGPSRPGRPADLESVQYAT